MRPTLPWWSIVSLVLSSAVIGFNGGNLMWRGTIDTWKEAAHEWRNTARRCDVRVAELRKESDTKDRAGTICAGLLRHAACDDLCSGVHLPVVGFDIDGAGQVRCRCGQ